MKTNNGLTVRLAGKDSFDRQLYRIFTPAKVLKVVAVNGKLYTRSRDGEPELPLKQEYQLEDTNG